MSRQRGTIQAVAGGICGALAGLAVAGWAFERASEARDRRRYPPPGRLIEIDGRRMHLITAGQGAPPVVLDAGLAGFTLDWGLVLPRIARFTTVCAYDRAGYGWSDPGPEPRTSEQLARELALLLDRSGVHGPYVLVGHSFAGYVLRVFARLYPERVAGLVLVDASTEDVVARLSAREVEQLMTLDRFVKRLLGLLAVVARFGVVRLLDRLGALTILSPFEKLPPRERAMAFALRSIPRFYATSLAEYRQFGASGELARGTPALGDIPVVALTATGSDRPDAKNPGGPLLANMTRLGVELQGDVAARLSTRWKHVVTADSGHQIALTQPDLVVDAVRELVQAIRETQVMAD